MNKAILVTVFIAFGALSAYSIHFSGGVLGFLLELTRHPASWQVFFDLVIALSLLLVLIGRDAKASGRPFWPWLLLTLATGSFGPLLYFITAKKKA
ncbi:MAG: hypothetical protein EAZ37_08760 [Burkholderiales bacterium]|nr:MAG: hypothetical protein EAZ37_08760 [Burkholderiales bacterium]